MSVAIALVLLWQAAQTVAAGETISEQLACAPMSLPAPPVAEMRVVGGYAHGRIMFGPGEPLVINAGTTRGVRAGQRYFVRRYVRDRFTPASADFQPNSIHTAGWVTILDARDNVAIATVTHACDGVVQGDYLEPFVAPVVPVPAPDAPPDFDHPGRIVMADERRQTGYPGLVMVLNRGTDHGVRAGQSLTIFRHAPSGGGPNRTVGVATVLSVHPQVSLVRIESSREAIYIGDLAAIHRASAQAQIH